MVRYPSSSFDPPSQANGFSSARKQAVAKVDENHPRDEQCYSRQFNQGDITHWYAKETDPVHKERGDDLAGDDEGGHRCEPDPRSKVNAAEDEKCTEGPSDQLPPG